jgi:hypothetical protein
MVAGTISSIKILHKGNLMNSVELSQHLIFRAKHLQEFVVITDVPSDFKINGMVPFDITISEGKLQAKVLAVDFNEAVYRLNDFLEICK